jgi:histidyl-tRNA synthetase
MKYANDRNVQYVAIIGEEEMTQGLIQLKNMETGDQEEMSIDELIFKLKK